MSRSLQPPPGLPSEREWLPSPAEGIDYRAERGDPRYICLVGVVTLDPTREGIKVHQELQVDKPQEWLKELEGRVEVEPYFLESDRLVAPNEALDRVVTDYQVLLTDEEAHVVYVWLEGYLDAATAIVWRPASPIDEYLG